MEKVFRYIIWNVLYYCVVLPLSALTAMLFEGAVADTYGWPTLGFWTVYQSLALLAIVAGFFWLPFTLRNLFEDE